MSKTYNADELRALDERIHRDIFGATEEFHWLSGARYCGRYPVPEYTTDPAAGETLWDKLVSENDPDQPWNFTQVTVKDGQFLGPHCIIRPANMDGLVKLNAEESGPTRLIALALAAVAACEAPAANGEGAGDGKES